VVLPRSLTGDSHDEPQFYDQDQGKSKERPPEPQEWSGATPRSQDEAFTDAAISDEEGFGGLAFPQAIIWQTLPRYSLR
jgi:hypothetical protein